MNNKANSYSPKNLNGTPQIENEEHNWLALHFLHTTKNDEEDKIPSNHLVEEHLFEKQLRKAGVTSHREIQTLAHLYHTCIRVGKTPVWTMPKAAFRTSTVARIWQKNITSDMV